MGHQNKMTGAAEQYQYILRDESMHRNFGIDLGEPAEARRTRTCGPHEFRPRSPSSSSRPSSSSTNRYAEDTMPRGVLGLNAPMFKGPSALHRESSLSATGIDPLYANRRIRFPWMSEMIDPQDEISSRDACHRISMTGGALSWD